MEKYTLPEWSFLNAHSHLGNELENRAVILHIRSASLIEIIDRDKDAFTPAPSVLKVNFKYTSPLEEERLSAILHYCATLDQNRDKEYIRKEILRPCAKWYCKYSAWEDGNVLNDIFNEE